MFRPVATDHARAALEALERQQLECASEHLRMQLREAPGDSRAVFLAARTARRLDDYAAAERLLHSFENQFDANPASELEWALLSVQQGDLGAQERTLRAFVEDQHAEAPLILEALAKGYGNVGQWSEMLRFLNVLLEQAPDHVLALVLRGQAFVQLRQDQKAVADYRRGLELDGGSHRARLGLAEALARLGCLPEATAEFEALRKKDAQAPAVILGLARCRHDACELDAAERLLDELLARQPDHEATLVERARLALRRGRPGAAELCAARAVKLAPRNREALAVLQRCSVVLGKTAQAEDCLARLKTCEAEEVQGGKLWLRLQHSPRDPELRHQVAEWHQRNGREAEALRWFFATLLADPNHGRTHAALAEHFDRARQPLRRDHHRRQARAAGVVEATTSSGTKP